MRRIIKEWKGPWICRRLGGQLMEGSTRDNEGMNNKVTFWQSVKKWHSISSAFFMTQILLLICFSLQLNQLPTTQQSVSSFLYIRHSLCESAKFKYRFCDFFIMSENLRIFSFAASRVWSQKSKRDGTLVRCQIVTIFVSFFAFLK